MGEVTLVRQAYRFALDPSVEQEALLASFTGASRFWFNQGLALVKERLDARARGEDVRVPWSYTQLCSEFKGDAVKDELAPWRARSRSVLIRLGWRRSAGPCRTSARAASRAAGWAFLGFASRVAVASR
jgi:hypothetical protein